MKTTIITKLSSLFVLSALVLGASGLAPNQAHAAWFSCNPDEVAEVGGNRIHVRCQSNMSVGGASIRFIAISNSNSGIAARFVAIANAALLSGKTFRADLPSSSATNVSGCGTGDCRTPVSIAVQD
jgi:hypothetical protein